MFNLRVFTLSNLTAHLIGEDTSKSHRQHAVDDYTVHIAEPVILRPSCAPISLDILCGEKGLASKPQASHKALAWAELCLHVLRILLQLICNSRLHRSK